MVCIQLTREYLLPRMTQSTTPNPRHYFTQHIRSDEQLDGRPPGVRRGPLGAPARQLEYRALCIRVLANGIDSDIALARQDVWAVLKSC